MEQPHYWKPEVTPSFGGSIKNFRQRGRFFDEDLKWDIVKMVKPHVNPSCTTVKMAH